MYADEDGGMSNPSGAPAPARLGVDSVRSRSQSAAPPWASGIVTGVETAVLSAGLVYAFVFSVVASAPSVDGSISADWAGAWDVGTSVWLLAHGVPITAGGTTITLIPLGLTLAVGIIAASVAGRVAVPAHASVLFAALSYGLIAAIVAASEHGGATTVWRAGIIGGLASGMGASFGLMRAHGFKFFRGLPLSSVVRRGIRVGVGAWATCLATGAALTVAWQVLAVDKTTEAVQSLAPDFAGGLTLAAGETAYVPTLAVWALAWLSGVGFALGSGSHYAPGEMIAGPVPEIPLLASLPEGSGGFLVAAPLVLVLGGVFVRIIARRSIPMGREGLSILAIAIAVTGGLTWSVVTIASGSAGGGVLSEVGPRAMPVSLAVSALVGGGMILASVGFAAVSRRSSRSASPTTTKRRFLTPGGAPEPPPRTPESNDPLRLW